MDDRGDYLIDKLNIGVYDVTIEQPGFKKQVATEFGLRSSRSGGSISFSRPGAPLRR